ncbi:MAG: hypothetical protein WC526_00835 [Patescibacteria group bacterium]
MLKTVLVMPLKLLWWTIRITARLALLLLESAFWLFHAVRWLVTIADDFFKAKRLMPAGELHCPRGHLVLPAREKQVAKCEACGWTFEASGFDILVCKNPECVSPQTSYINCPTCGLSVRNPYRLGRP